MANAKRVKKKRTAKAKGAQSVSVNVFVETVQDAGTTIYLGEPEIIDFDLYYTIDSLEELHSLAKKLEKLDESEFVTDVLGGTTEYTDQLESFCEMYALKLFGIRNRSHDEKRVLRASYEAPATKRKRGTGRGWVWVRVHPEYTDQTFVQLSGNDDPYELDGMKILAPAVFEKLGLALPGTEWVKLYVSLDKE